MCNTVYDDSVHSTHVDGCVCLFTTIIDVPATRLSITCLSVREHGSAQSVAVEMKVTSRTVIYAKIITTVTENVSSASPVTAFQVILLFNYGVEICCLIKLYKLKCDHGGIPLSCEHTNIRMKSFQNQYPWTKNRIK